jgi:hypothetical protein
MWVISGTLERVPSRMTSDHFSEGQETSAIVPAPENARKKKLRGMVDRGRKKNNFLKTFLVENNLSILFTSNCKIMTHMPSNYI